MENSKFSFSEGVKTCSRMHRTEKSPFVVFILRKTSGCFMGMGSIIDRRTVITAEKAIQLPRSSFNQMLVLAGSLSPWWGKYSQVRQVKDVLYNEFEVVLLVLEKDWIFSKYVAPIKLPKRFHRSHTPVFGKHAIIFGIVLDETHQWGRAVPKGKEYYASLNRAVHEYWDACELSFGELKTRFDRDIHYCLYPNDTFCHGCLGSPSVGINNMGEVNIVGIIIDTTCRSYDLVVKISYLDKWIKAHTLLGHQMITH